MREKCPYSEFFWSEFSRIRTEYREIRSICPYLVKMRENTDQKNSEYGHFMLSSTVLRLSHVTSNKAGHHPCYSLSLLPET